MEFEVKLLQTLSNVFPPRYGEEDAWGWSQMDRKKSRFCWDLETQNGCVHFECCFLPFWCTFGAKIAMHGYFPFLDVSFNCHDYQLQKHRFRTVLGWKHHPLNASIPPGASRFKGLVHLVGNLGISGLVICFWRSNVDHIGCCSC